jgi:amphi-Trp domain-containing protein
MTEETVFEFEQEQTRSEIADSLRLVSEQLDDDGEVTFTTEDRQATITVPSQSIFEVEIERERAEDDDEGELSIELEIEWEASSEILESATSVESMETADEPSERDSTAASDRASHFQLYRDRAGEWRWRLVHHNGNIIATSGEGYTSRQNAEKGMRSVMANAAGAEVVSE